jgi:AcrR family transcriptional regulator
VSRRQERKLKIAQAAVRLFEERGLAGTTVEMIAAEAGISPRTFFRYFDTKESAAFPDHGARVADLERRFDARLPSRAPISDVVDVASQSAMEFFADPDLYHRRYRLLHSSEVLRDLERIFDRSYEERIVAFLTACDIDRVTACACAAAVVAVVNAALDLWARSPSSNAEPARAALKSGLEMVLDAFSRVARGSDEVARHPTPAQLAVLVSADDPLRQELLAAVKRGALVIDPSRPDRRSAADDLMAS